MRKKVLSWFGTLLILAGVLLPAVHAVAAQRTGDAATAGSWNLSSSGPAYANGNTTWTYTFSSTGRANPLSQLDLVLCTSFDEGNVTASHGGQVGSDDQLGLPHVIKWEAALLRGTDTVTVTYEGLWASGSQSWHMLAGADQYSGTVGGPLCEELEPDFEISKTVSATNDSSTGEQSLVLTGGGTAHYFYTITNTGNSPLTLGTVSDDKIGAITFPGGEISPGHSVTAHAEKSFPSLGVGSPPQTEINTVTATASFAGQTIGPKSASATVINQAPEAEVGFSVAKTVSESSAGGGSDTLTLEGGGTAYFQYAVTNTGEVPLTITSAVDDVLGEISALVGLTLAAGETQAAIVDQEFAPLPPASPSQSTENTFTVTASYAGGELDPRSASATVINVAPSAAPGFAVAKTVSSSQDPETGKETESLIGGGTVYFFYTVTNTGNVPLSVVSGQDNRLGPLAFDRSVINPGESAHAGPVAETFAPLPVGSQPETVENTLTVLLAYGREVMEGTDTATVINYPQPEPQEGDFAVTKLAAPEDDITSAQKSITLTGGGTAWFFYTITNTGDLPLHIDSVDDNVLGTVAIQDDQRDLSPGESLTVSLSQPFPTLAPGSADQTTSNLVTVSATFSDRSTATREDRATVVNRAETVRKAFTVSKLVGETQNPSSAGKALNLQGGGTAWFFFTITNTGNVPLSITDAWDNVLGDLSLAGTALAPGQSTPVKTVARSFPALGPTDQNQTETNTVTVTASFPVDESTLTHTDTATVINHPVAAHPDFTVTKRVSTANNPATGSASVTLTGGGTAYFFYTVTNTGNVPLTIVESADDLLGPINFDKVTVQPGESTTATLSKTFPNLPVGAPDQVETNTAAITASAPWEETIAKSAQATVVNRARQSPPPVWTPTPGFAVEKWASTANDPTTGQALVTLTGGGTVYFFYTIRNTGDTALTVESATDDMLGAITFSSTTIAPGATATATAQKSFGALPVGAADRSETNTLTVTVRSGGSLLGPRTAQATVINRAEAARPDFAVTKRVSATSDPASGKSNLTLSATGGTAYFFYTVTNTGNVPITITEAVDDKLGAISFSPAVLPVGGTATAALTKQFGPGEQESNVVTVKGAYNTLAVGPKSDVASVQVEEGAVGSLEVRVMDTSPRNNGSLNPIAGATVTLSGGLTGKTNHAGRILFTDLPYGIYQVTGASADPLNPTQVSLKIGNGTVEIGRTHPDEVLTILLSWDSPTAPPPLPAPSIVVAVCENVAQLGGVVTAVGPDGSTRTAVQSSGGYTLTGLTAGTWTVTLTSPGLEEPVTRTLVLRSDGDLAENRYALDLSGVCPTVTGGLSGRICSPRAPGSEITGKGPDGEINSVSVPADGRLGEWREYKIVNLAPGSWMITLHSPGMDPISQTVEVRAGSTTPVNDFTLACTGQAAPGVGTPWFYVTGGLLVGSGLLLRRRARV